jgi:hypothetical protein
VKLVGNYGNVYGRLGTVTCQLPELFHLARTGCSENSAYLSHYCIRGAKGLAMGVLEYSHLMSRVMVARRDASGAR